ncbi:deoxyribonuclease-2-alpha-like [Parambassis ranga]|uniref:Deoxyribonuclease-2-alpha n=1 Tax=Parambassis ranga TaxID=210632 RepID=A0A6P7HTR4_9TELE|nr:deoxyribonuclease-2-alpha-like [Parambassis ranga]
MEMIRIIRLLLSVGILCQVCDSEVKCRNDNGVEVDWYIVYKFPKKTGDSLSYLYMDESTNGWRRSSKTIDSNSGALANTLKPLLDFYVTQTEGFGYLLYNDQPPDQFKPPASSFGHSKGVVMLDRQTGVWLSHSTPKFPAYRERNFWPNNGNTNAQTFMCVTFSYDQFKEIGLQLKYIHAHSYDHSIPTTFHKDLRCVAQRECRPRNKPWIRKTLLTSIRGHTFTSFAKYGRFKDDLYSGLIAPDLNQALYVKSWGSMRGPLPSNCSIPHHVFNVKTVNLARKTFPDTVDHSKWCVTSDSRWTCIADMNRERSQMERGGGAICINDPVVGSAFNALITNYEKCSSPRHGL